jgi:hypothetical protein
MRRWYFFQGLNMLYCAPLVEHWLKIQEIPGSFSIHKLHFFSQIKYALLCSIGTTLTYNVRGPEINSDG